MRQTFIYLVFFGRVLIVKLKLCANYEGTWCLLDGNNFRLCNVLKKQFSPYYKLQTSEGKFRMILFILDHFAFFHLTSCAWWNSRLGLGLQGHLFRMVLCLTSLVTVGFNIFIPFIYSSVSSFTCLPKNKEIACLVFHLDLFFEFEIGKQTVRAIDCEQSLFC